jgi:hypothetical protein
MAMKKLLVRTTSHILTNRKPANWRFTRRLYDRYNFQMLFSFSEGLAWIQSPARSICCSMISRPILTCSFSITFPLLVAKALFNRLY